MNILSSVLILFFSCATAGKLPLDFKKCLINDIFCLKDAIQDAIPKLKSGIPHMDVPSLDPLLIPEMTIGAAQVVNLVQKYKNIELFGLSNIEIISLEFDLLNGKLELDLKLSGVLDMNSTYEADGKVMILTVHGNGKSMMRLEEPFGKLSFEVETYEKGNETYLRGTDVDLRLQCKHVVYKFDNLFDGNIEFGETINKVLNDNWQMVFDELISGYTQVYGATLMNVMNKLFKHLPMSELFING